MMIEYVDKIVDMRRHLVQEEARFPRRADAHLQGHGDAVEPVGHRRREALRLGRRDSTSRPSPTSRTPSTSTTSAAPAPSTTATRRRRRPSRAMLKKAGVDFACLAKEELCNGETARRLGNEYLYQAMAQALHRELQRLRGEEDHRQLPALLQHDQERVPAVRRQLRGDPRRRAGAAADRRRAGSRCRPSFGKRTAYHDSCYYGRFNDDLRRAARGARRRPARSVDGDARATSTSACAAVRAAGACGSRRIPDKRVNLLRTDQALETEPRGDRRLVPVLHDDALRRHQGEGPRGQGADARRHGDRRQGDDVAFRA